MDANGPDLRSALALLAAKGELTRVAGEVHWDRELGTVAREVLRRSGPALLFENITGYNTPDARCGSLTTGLLAGHRRIALLLGHDDAVPNRTLVEQVTETNRRTLAPRFVDDGPVREHVVRGADVDLTQFPVPRWHHLDGGRYINTFAAVVTKDPQSGWVNAGVYRGMIVGRNKIAMLMVPSQHWGRHWAAHVASGEPMPVASVYGWHPVMDFLAGSPLPAGVSEYDVMGAYLASPCRCCPGSPWTCRCRPPRRSSSRASSIPIRPGTRWRARSASSPATSPTCRRRARRWRSPPSTTGSGRSSAARWRGRCRGRPARTATCPRSSGPPSPGTHSPRPACPACWTSSRTR
ncbi:hypothetical protein BJF78_30265 [Pseudonocardia sp. CNS-139]|nr:hypothetical protein BJF78_30265 [Pseudonocardia sp. CNS-139]